MNPLFFFFLSFLFSEPSFYFIDVVNPLTNGAMLLYGETGKEIVYKITPDFIIYIDKQIVTKWKCPIPP